MSEQQPLHVLHVKAQNVLGIEVVDVALSEQGVIVSGDNGQGKSSFLNLVAMAFGGAKAEPQVPIREGADEGSLEIVAGSDGKPSLVIERHYKHGPPSETGEPGKLLSKVVVRDADGAPISSPQKRLDALYSTLCFDVGQFIDPPGEKTVDGKAKKQVETLLAACPIDIDLGKAASQRAIAYEKRTNASRDLKTYTAEIGLLKKLDVPERVDLDAKRAEIAAERAAAEEARRLGDQIARQDAELAKLAETYKRLKADREAVAARAAALPPAKDVSALEAAISAGERQNEERIRIEAGNKQYDATLTKLGAAKKAVDDLTATIEALDAAKLAALGRASFPVPGMGVDETLGVTLEQDGKKVPFAQLNRAKQVEIAVLVLAKLNPTLKVALVRDGNSLDGATLAALWRACRVLNVQPVIERVAQDQAGALVFKRGKIEGVVPERAS